MKKNIRLLTLLAFSTLMAFSSCNRGYGCPSNFSIQDFITDLAEQALHFLL